MNVLRALSWPVIGFAALVTTFAVMQNQLLYFPAKAPVSDLVSERLSAWPSEHDFRGLLAAPPGAVRGTVIVFHGNAGHAGHRDFYVRALQPLGLRVILAEYPGYGPRDGDLGQGSLVDDAEASLVTAHRQFGDPLVVMGESLGAAVAALAVSRRRELGAALMLITPWDKLENVASHHYPWLPVRWLLRDRYDSAESLAAWTERPTVIAVAARDSIVPARFGLALYESLPEGRKQLRLIEGAEHNDWPDHVDGDWWRQVMDFLLPAEHAR